MRKIVICGTGRNIFNIRKIETTAADCKKHSNNEFETLLQKGTMRKATIINIIFLLAISDALIAGSITNLCIDERTAGRNTTTWQQSSVGSKWEDATSPPYESGLKKIIRNPQLTSLSTDQTTVAFGSYGTTPSVKAEALSRHSNSSAKRSDRRRLFVFSSLKYANTLIQSSINKEKS